MGEVAKKKILFVMSSVRHVKSAEDALKKSLPQVEFLHATGSAEALARCESGSFDMVICDYYMPNLSGLEILRSLRKRGFEKPFILIIDFQSQGVIVDALRAGADDTVIIDVAFDEILPVIVEKNFRNYELRAACEQMQKRLRESQAEVRDLSVYDELTNLWNRRYVVKKLEEECVRARRYNRPLSVLLIDVDHFGDINRRHSQEAGNLVLQKLSAMMAALLRKVDVLARYGGDEFFVILPETPMEKAHIVAQKLMDELKSHVFVHKAESFTVTVSIGISWYPRFGQEDHDELLSTVGKALSKAKTSGFNCVKVAGKFK
jgi:diguanylate cyclase (GGDEF)-like protein